MYDDEQFTPYRERPLITDEEVRERDQAAWALTDATRADLIASIMDSISGEAESAREWADTMYERLEYVPRHILVRAFVVELTGNGAERKARERLRWLAAQAKALNEVQP